MSTNPDLVAFVGEDEFDGTPGLKQGSCAAGLIPIVAIIEDQAKITKPYLLNQMQAQANHFGKQIRLVRYVAVEELLVINPGGKCS
jgi:hypothetical protein